MRLSFRGLPPPAKFSSSLARSIAFAGGFVCLLIGVYWSIELAAEPRNEPAKSERKPADPADISPRKPIPLDEEDFHSIEAVKTEKNVSSTSFDDLSDMDWRPRGSLSNPIKDGNVRRAATAQDDGPVGPPLLPIKDPIPKGMADPKPKKNDSLPETELIPTLPSPLKSATDKKKLDPKAIVLLAAARNAVARGELTEGLSRIEEYLELYPSDREVRKEYAGLLVQAERFKQAVEIYRALIGDEPDNLTLLASLADVYLFMKDFRKAAALLASALEKAPSNIEYAIKLARTHAFDGDTLRAFQVFDRYLARFKNDETRLPKSYGALLIDLGQIETAIQFLLPLRRRTPEDLEVLGFLLRAYARQGDRLKALEIVNDLAERKPTAIPIRLELAEGLYQATDLEIAGLIYGQILRTDPTHSLANIGLARVYLSQFLPKEAAAILHRIKPIGTARRTYLFAWAEYHQAVGEYTQAKQIYRSFLSKDDNDNESRLSLGRLFAFTREDEKAKAEFAKLPGDSFQVRSARLEIVAALTAQRRFAEALDLCRLMVREFPNEGSWRATSARVLAKTGAAPAAEAICQEFLRNETRNEPAIAEVRLALGKVLLDNGKTAEAAREFEQALSSPFGRVASGFYGLARARARLGSQEAGQSLLEAAVGFLGDPRGRLLLADQFVADHEDGPGAEFCEAALRLDPANLAVRIRLVDIRQRQANVTGDIAVTVALAEAMLHVSPKNVRAQLALARALSTAKKLKDSVRVYDDLILADGDFNVPKRERARVLFSDKAFGASAAAYAERATTPIRETPRLEREGFESALPSLPSTSVGNREGIAILHGGIAGIGAATPVDPDTLPVFERLLAESAARRADALGAELEGRAKSLNNWRKYESIPVYQQLLAQEPDNTEAMFDLGQVYSATKQTNTAIAAYRDLLQADPLHREAAIAIDRAGLELQPQLRENFDFFGQRGRNNFAAIDRYRYNTSVRIPYRDEDEYGEFTFTRARNNPVGGNASDGNILSFRGQVKPVPTSLIWAQVNYETYQPGSYSDRVTFDVGNQLEPCDLFRAYYSGFLENVSESAGSMKQDVYRGGVRFGGDARLSRRWEVGGNYLVAAYSDNNSLNNFNVFNNVLLSYLPCQLKFVTRFDYFAFAHGSIPDPNDPANATNAIHPYFSPKGFGIYENRLELLQYLSRDNFSHANVCYYSLQYGIAWDSAFANYHRFRALFNYDVRPWLSIGADTNLTLSTVYRQVGATAYLVLRLPHFHQ